MQQSLQIFGAIDDFPFFNLTFAKPAEHNRRVSQLFGAVQLVDGLGAMSGVGKFQPLDR